MVQKKHKKNFYSILLNSFFKRGKKQNIKKLIDNLFLSLSIEYKISSSLILQKVFKKLFTIIEIRKLKIRRRLYLVPFSIKNNRQYFLIIKWLKMAVIEEKQKVSFIKKLKEEIKKILFNSKTSRSINLKRLNTKEARLNKAYVHYRW